MPYKFPHTIFKKKKKSAYTDGFLSATAVLGSETQIKKTKKTEFVVPAACA